MKFGSPARIRTEIKRINSTLLYQLRYRRTLGNFWSGKLDLNQRAFGSKPNEISQTPLFPEWSPLLDLNQRVSASEAD